jgi:dipeptidyl aminopeptidase/acylaminoacyl peptidase
MDTSASVPAAPAATASEPSSRRAPVTSETFLQIRTPSDPQLSPDGRLVAFVLHEWVPDQPKARGRLWLVETADGDPRPLTSGSVEDLCPRWSPDGKQLAFLSRRDEHKDKAYIYVMPASGGEARRVCVVPNGASDLEWSPDGSRIAFLTPEGPEPSGEPKVNEPLRHQRLWTVRPESDTPEPVTPTDLTIWSYAWSPDSARFAVYFSEGPGETDWYRGQIGVVAAAGGAVRQITHLTRQAGALAWARDGQQLLYVSEEWSDRPLVGGDVYAISAEGGEPRHLTPDISSSVSWLRELPEAGRWLYVAWDGLSNQIGTLDQATGILTPITRDFYVGDWAWPRLTTTPDLRRLVATHTDQQVPFDLYVGDLTGEGEQPAISWRRLTRLNPLVEETLELAPTERMSYEGADGWRIEALFTPPLRPTTGTPPPLVLMVHGGPTSAYREAWGDLLTQRLAAAGYAVLRPNPRGSIGRGVAFADAVLGDMGGKDLEDVLRGVDAVVAQGRANGERVAIMGWSYGGFMTAWAVTQTTRFKAAVMGAGVCDYHSFHAQTNIADWDMRFLAADPSENPEAYRARSAITFVRQATTPTLIQHGENDPCVPVNQAYAFYRALRERGVPTELAIYPRAGHGLSERDHLRDRVDRVLRWFERYL